MKLRQIYSALFYLIISFCFVLFVNTESYSQNDSLLFDVLGPEDVIAPINKEEIEIISASRSAKKLADLPVTTHVITHDEIIQNGYVTLVDVLKSIPGIRVSQPGSGELGEMFEMRGLIGNGYTKILVNNVPIKPSLVSGLSLDAQLPIRQAERIEVIFGPASSVYGADATAGVINIITKEADNGIFSAADISIGGNGYRYINFQAGGKAGKNKNILKYSFYGSQRQQDSLNIFNDKELYKPLSYLDQTNQGFDYNGEYYKMSDITDEMLVQMGNDSILPYHYQGNLQGPIIKSIPLESRLIGFELKFKGWSMSYLNMYRKSHSSIGRSSYLFKYNDPLNYVEEKTDNFVISYNKQFKHLQSTTNMQFQNYELDNTSSYGTTWIEEADKYYVYARSSNIYLEQLLTYTKKKFEIVAGTTLQLSSDIPQTNYTKEPFNKDLISFFNDKDSIKDSKFGEFGFNPENYFNFSGFMQGYYTARKLTLVAGVRYDFNMTYKSSTNLRLAALYKLSKKITLRASCGTAFKAPPPNTTYNSLAYIHKENPDSIYYAIIPNENLKPERSFAYEFGIRKRFFENIYLDISFFHNLIRNLIVSDFVENIDREKYPLAAYNEQDQTRTNINSDKAVSVISGSETSIRINNLISAIKLDAQVSFTVSEQNQTTPEGEVVQTINKSPTHTGKFKISMVPVKKAYICFEGNWANGWNRTYLPSANYYVDPEYTKIENFFTLDGIVSLRLNKNLNFFIKMTNIFDKNYAGIDATGMDIDLRYNPQYGRNTRIGLSFKLN